MQVRYEQQQERLALQQQHKENIEEQIKQDEHQRPSQKHKQNQMNMGAQPPFNMDPAIYPFVPQGQYQVPFPGGGTAPPPFDIGQQPPPPPPNFPYPQNSLPVYPNPMLNSNFNQSFNQFQAGLDQIQGDQKLQGQQQDLKKRGSGIEQGQQMQGGSNKKEKGSGGLKRTKGNNDQLQDDNMSMSEQGSQRLDTLVYVAFGGEGQQNQPLARKNGSNYGSVNDLQAQLNRYQKNVNGNKNLNNSYLNLLMAAQNQLDLYKDKNDLDSQIDNDQKSQPDQRYEDNTQHNANKLQNLQSADGSQHGQDVQMQQVKQEDSDENRQPNNSAFNLNYNFFQGSMLPQINTQTNNDLSVAQIGGQGSLRDSHGRQRGGMEEVKSGFKRIESNNNMGSMGGDTGLMYQEMTQMRQDLQQLARLMAELISDKQAQRNEYEKKVKEFTEEMATLRVFNQELQAQLTQIKVLLNINQPDGKSIFGDLQGSIANKNQDYTLKTSDENQVTDGAPLNTSRSMTNNAVAAPAQKEAEPILEQGKKSGEQQRNGFTRVVKKPSVKDLQKISEQVIKNQPNNNLLGSNQQNQNKSSASLWSLGQDKKLANPFLQGIYDQSSDELSLQDILKQNWSFSDLQSLQQTHQQQLQQQQQQLQQQQQQQQQGFQKQSVENQEIQNEKTVQGDSELKVAANHALSAQQHEIEKVSNQGFQSVQKENQIQGTQNSRDTQKRPPDNILQRELSVQKKSRAEEH